jgi:microcystin-dependent protein
LPINQNQSLFSLLGTTYGGDGRTTFALPDLRSRVPIHEGAGAGLTPRALGQRGGTEGIGLSVAQMPNHTHADGTGDDELQAKLRASSVAATTSDPTGASLAAANVYSADPPSVDMNSDSLGATLANVGGNGQHNNMPPVTTINFCIALQGLFPSRN